MEKLRCSRCRRPIEGELAYRFEEEVVCVNCRHGYLNEQNRGEGVCTRCGESGEVMVWADMALCDECRFDILLEAEFFAP